jgi:hypothetical protein
MKRMKSKKGRQNEKKKRQRKQPSAPTHGDRKAFDQLLDDAIFGVAPKK